MTKRKKFFLHNPLVGKVFDRLMTEGNPFMVHNGYASDSRVPYVVCSCICGSRNVYHLGSMKAGRITSCGCKKKKKKIMIGV